MQTTRSAFHQGRTVSRSSTGFRCWSVFLSPATALLMLLFCGQGVKGQGIEWVRSTLNGPNMGSVISLARLPSGEILAGTYRSLFLSSDEGNTWVQKSTGLPAQPAYSIAVLPTGVVFAVSGGNLYRSADRGTNWTLVLTGKTHPRL